MKKPRRQPGQLTGPGHSGRPVKHGANAIIYREEVIKKHPELVRYVRATYAALLRDLAPGDPDGLSAARRVLLDRMASLLLTAGLLDTYISKNGIIRKDRLEQRVLECEPCVQTLLSVNTAILKGLLALGLERRTLDVTMTPEQMLLDAHADVVAQEAAKDGQGGDGDA